MACAPVDREGAVREVAQVYELIKIHQPLLFLHCSSQSPTPSTSALQLAQSLLSEALRALNVALSVMKQQQQRPALAPPPFAAGPVRASVKDEPHLSSHSPAAHDSEAVTSSPRKGRRRRSVVEGKNSSWVNLTTVPYEDGYEWRKYGEKRINGTQYTRSYFRCTYRDDRGCLATKHIQQKDNNDPPMFQVAYNNDHTCNCITNTTAAKKNNKRNGNNLPFLGHCNGSEGAINNPPNGGHVMIKQEPTVPPPLVEASAIPADQTPRQEPFSMVSNQLYDTVSEYHAGIPSMASTTAESSPCISGVLPSDECLDMMGQTATAVMETASLHDLELFLLYDNFKYY